MVFPVVMYGCESWTKKGWVPKNWCFWTVVLGKTLESPLNCKEIQPVHPKGDQSWVFIGRTDAEAETPILWPPDVAKDVKNWCEELTHWKRPWCWERLKVGGERDDRGWEGWMASSTWWTWVWISSRSWWWTGRAAVHGVAESDMTEQMNKNKLPDTLRPFQSLVRGIRYWLWNRHPGWLVEAVVGMGWGREGRLNGRGGWTQLRSVCVPALSEGVSASVSMWEDIHTSRLSGDLALEPRLWPPDSVKALLGPHPPRPHPGSSTLRLVLGDSGQRRAEKAQDVKGKGFLVGPHGTNKHVNSEERDKSSSAE